MKTCRKCKTEKDISNFHKDSMRKSGYRDICKTCKKEENNKYNLNNRESKLLKSKEYYKNNKIQKTNYRLKNKNRINKIKANYRLKNIETIHKNECAGRLRRKYGLTIEQKNQMIESQNNKCSICNEVFNKTPNVDHNHKTNKIRGLLCGNCNRMLGLAKENIITLNNAINYLKKYET